MPAVIRKTLLHVETTLIEGGKAAAVPLEADRGGGGGEKPVGGDGVCRKPQACHP